MPPLDPRHQAGFAAQNDCTGSCTGNTAPGRNPIASSRSLTERGEFRMGQSRPGGARGPHRHVNRARDMSSRTGLSKSENCTARARPFLSEVKTGRSVRPGLRSRSPERELQNRPPSDGCAAFLRRPRWLVSGRQRTKMRRWSGHEAASRRRTDRRQGARRTRPATEILALPIVTPCSLTSDSSVKGRLLDPLADLRNTGSARRPRLPRSSESGLYDGPTASSVPGIDTRPMKGVRGELFEAVQREGRRCFGHLDPVVLNLERPG